jgi:hypothetical protein
MRRVYTGKKKGANVEDRIPPYDTIRLGMTQDVRGAEWKVSIAKRLHKETTAKNPGIAERVQMGHPNYVSNLMNKA